MPVKVFWTEPTGYTNLYLRRFTFSSECACPSSNWGHDSKVFIGKYKERHGEKVEWRENTFYKGAWHTNEFPDDGRWPARCMHTNCVYDFDHNDEWQVQQESIYVDPITGQEYSLRMQIPGMMWDAWWMGVDWTGADGISLAVTLPNGSAWMVDSRASNCDSLCKHCTKPYNAHTNPQGSFTGRCVPTSEYNDGSPTYEDARPHKCWIRHGDPRTSNVHVDKNGVTCGAGAGSIISGSYHGFLHNGFLTD